MFHLSSHVPLRARWTVSLLCVRLCGTWMLSGLVRATVGAATFTLASVWPPEAWGGYTGAVRGADVYSCQPTRSLQSAQPEVEVMMLTPPPPPLTHPLSLCCCWWWCWWWWCLPYVFPSVELNIDPVALAQCFRAALICLALVKQKPLLKLNKLWVFFSLQAK